MNGYTFSPASSDDIEEIVRIYHSLVGTPGCTWDMEYPSRETAESDMKSNSLYTLRKDGVLISVASAGAFNELAHLPWACKNPCELARIGVKPAMQGQGIGTMMLQNIMRTAREKGFDGIRMLVSKTNFSALALYNKNGFVNCGEVFMYDIDFFCYELKFDITV